MNILLEPINVKLRAMTDWQSYPANVSDHDPLQANAEIYSKKMQKLSKALFIQDLNQSRIYVDEIFSQTLPCMKHPNKEYGQLASYISNADVQLQKMIPLESTERHEIRTEQGTTSIIPPIASQTEILKCKRLEFSTGVDFHDYLLNYTVSPCKYRLFSVPRLNSGQPLDITEESARKLLSCVDVPSQFLDLVFKFGVAPLPTDDGIVKVFLKDNRKDSIEVGYLFHYVEENNRKEEERSWSDRCTAIYHRFSKNAGGESVCLIFHPRVETTGFQELAKQCQIPSSLSKMCQNPFNIHFLLLSSYFENWIPYIDSIGKAFGEMVNQVTALDIQDPSQYDLTFEKLQDLQYIEGNILSLTAKFKATRATISILKLANKKGFELGHFNHEVHSQTQTELESYDLKLDSYQVSLENLLKRSKGIFSLVSSGLDIKNQRTAAKIDQHLLALAEDTVDDSSTVRVVTLVTLVYLPSSFVATLFGMNFFAFQDPAPSSDGILVSRKFWIYILIAVPLTALTLTYWFYKSHRRRSKRQKQAQSTASSCEKGEAKLEEKAVLKTLPNTSKQKPRNLFSWYPFSVNKPTM